MPFYMATKLEIYITIKLERLSYIQVRRPFRQCYPLASGILILKLFA